ncbi:hypothetical protein ACH5RR_036866 [Cinchona calisaya]|uniref:BHLH domain-containing protein n=1 Tax=Cinchona calisaya TaxID=153742 RepID=A0ABD2Y7K9_9GENT
MNPTFPDWNIGADFPVLVQKNKPLGLDRELVELLWENGQVVQHSQTHHQIESRLINKQNHDQSISRGNTGGSGQYQVTSLIQDAETVSWIDDPFDKEFNSNFLSEFPISNPAEQQHNYSVVLPNDKPSNVVTSVPPRFNTVDSSKQHHCRSGGIVNVPLSVKADLRSSNSHCGSNQVVNDADTSRVSSCGIGDHRGLSAAVAKDHSVGKMSSQMETVQTETIETALTSSSSGGSGTSFGRACYQSTGTNSLKRKSRDVEDSECQSKAAELESAARKKQALKSGSSRKSRATEVHNLSERRRRDRINEKMRALQELLPNSNKTDKASMLDEAIEYMKSLQMQLQMMWMGSAMAPMMFPGVQHYMSRLGMGMGPLAMPSIHNQMHLSRLPLVDQATMPNQATVCPQTTVLNPINYHAQLENSKLSDQYANYMAFHPLQSASQNINNFSFGSNTAQQNHILAPSANSNGPSIG